jgi:hypothetical protein
MRTPSLLLLAGLLMLCGVSPSAALDPRNVDILGLHLGMSRQDLIGRLAAQGIARSRIHEEAQSCATDPAASCVQTLAAPIPDGTLLIRFVVRAGPGSETVWSIAYTLAGRGAGEPEMIRNAVLDRFGPPTSNDPPVWCVPGSASGCSQPDQPQLMYNEGPGTSSTLTLVDPGALRAGG